MTRNFQRVCAAIGLIASCLATAQVPSPEALEGYKAFYTRYEGETFGFSQEDNDKKCFAEHLCAAEGTIGLTLDCEDDVRYCFDVAVGLYEPSEFVPFDPLCTSLFEAMSLVQNALIASAPSCERPPPARALLPTVTPGEARCLANFYCTDYSEEYPELERVCRKGWDTCTKPMSALRIGGRSECRSMREHSSSFFDEQIGIGSPSSSYSCKREMQDPVLASAPGASGETEAKTDEFDLGDLDF